ncbi:MAG: HAD-IIIC family phosphatase [Oscillospiraceae bacterium]|nr:HAD-IIIC family phosphatase [Oscillospiraceae bacterium]
MLQDLCYPFDSADIMQRRRKLLRQLKENEGNVKLRIAVLGGSTTSDIVKMLELFLRNRGIVPEFYESEYARYWEDAMFENPELEAFKPELFFIHTSSRNIKEMPCVSDSKELCEHKLEQTYAHFEQMWERLASVYGCPIIQNNFELPMTRLLGNREAGCPQGKIDFITRLNVKFYDYAASHKNFYIHDIQYLSACYGLDKWLEPSYWHLYKYALAVPAIPEFAYNLSNIVCSLMGKNKKVLALDLDNTLWGGVIGDDGQAGIEIGQETSMGQAYAELQQYIKDHSQIGVLLTVNSKNDYENAISGLEHPDGILKPDDFTLIKANWEPKSQNLLISANELYLLPESFVFVYDNPAERAIVSAQLPDTPVVAFDSVEECILAIDRSGYFEVTSLSGDDAKRTEMYKANAQRQAAAQQFGNYQDFLLSLDMVAEIRDFDEIHLPRITQLTNKSNQFNVTTKRYTQTEMEETAASPDHIRLYGRLVDKFGDNGIVSVVIGRKEDTQLHMELWLMSCRVLKRDMELAMLDELVKAAKAQGITEIIGYYYPTAKNAMVKELYGTFGFEKIAEDADGNSQWKLATADYQPQNHVIKIKEESTV